MSDFSISLESDVDFNEFTERNKRYASMAINKTAAYARTAARREIQNEVNLPANYIGSNLNLGPPSTADTLAREVIGRHRPTSLARYARGTPESTIRAKSTTVEVAPGVSKKMGRAFLIRLKGVGGDTSGPNANIGLAIRLKPGEVIHNKRISISEMEGGSTKGLTLLYGPSIDQLFKHVREDISGDVSDKLRDEFIRLTKTGV